MRFGLPFLIAALIAALAGAFAPRASGHDARGASHNDVFSGVR
jgi:hypothetical protein